MFDNENSNTPAKPGDNLKAIGGGMVGLCLLILLVGGRIARMFFPETQGAGLTTTALLLLIPTWSIGIIGLVLLLVGWIQSKGK